ncbi:glycosyltransferase [Microlunatus sp. Gsoil 973]|uniref:glycosyltransferase n=1 Tax=Microlunatus sp. Gsoil 973 TaxID=2672569 RepID=UPI0012B4F405|nr:glycosyltransferase [Microlunatus sp. Gsoil 973]QGN31931.1 glycosyltransferase [Microlunatus sp. Gsoil 973]
MRIVLVSYGSRGDLEPLAALALALRANGVEVHVCAPPDLGDLMEGIGVEHSPVGGPVRALATGAIRGTSRRPLPEVAAELTADAYSAVLPAARDADLVLGAGVIPVAAAARGVAEKLGIAYVGASFTPTFLPSQQHPPVPWPGQVIPPEVTDNRGLWELNDRHVHGIFGPPINAFRESVGLPAVDSVRDYIHTKRPLLASDPVIGPWLQPADLDAVQTGAWMRHDHRSLPAELEAFLSAGDPPVYVGFGSMPLPAAEPIARIAIEAVRARGCRTLLGSGWAGLAPIDDRDDSFVIGEVNQQALFGRVAAVVHHGGAGTTHTAARAGAPQVIVPQVADQPYWGGRVTDLGIGTRHEGSAPTVESLAEALTMVSEPQVAVRAGEVAGMVRTDGAPVAAALLVAGS